MCQLRCAVQIDSYLQTHVQNLNKHIMTPHSPMHSVDFGGEQSADTALEQTNISDSRHAYNIGMWCHDLYQCCSCQAADTADAMWSSQSIIPLSTSPDVSKLLGWICLSCLASMCLHLSDRFQETSAFRECPLCPARPCLHVAYIAAWKDIMPRTQLAAWHAAANDINSALIPSFVMQV